MGLSFPQLTHPCQSSRGIADVLNINPHTVINHLRSIDAKLHVNTNTNTNTNTGAVAKAIREGLV